MFLCVTGTTKSKRHAADPGKTGSAVMSQRRERLARAPCPGGLADSCKGGVALEVLLLLRSHGNAAATLMRAERRERGFRLITIRTSWSSAFKKVISLSTENPAIL